MKAVKTILVSIGVLLVATFAGVLYLATYLDEHKDLSQGGLSKALGREVRIEGGVKMAW